MNILDICDLVSIDNDEHWHEERAKGIGGSDVGALVGVVSGEYNSPYNLWCLKTGRIPPDITGNEATKWGHRLEATVADAYAEETVAAVMEWPGVSFVNKEYPWMRANVDRFIVEPCDYFPPGLVTTWTGYLPTDEPPCEILGVLECKTSGIASHGTAHHWWDGDEETVPEGYLCQGYHYGLVTGLRNVQFAALLPPHGLQVRPLDWDDEIANDLLKIEADFWRLVTSDTPPPIDATAATTQALSQMFSESVSGERFDGGVGLLELWEQYQEAKKTAEYAASVKQALRNQIVAAFGKAEVGTVGGTPICTFKTSRRSNFDQKSFAAQYPDLAKKFTTTFPVRTLRAAGKAVK